MGMNRRLPYPGDLPMLEHQTEHLMGAEKLNKYVKNYYHMKFHFHGYVFDKEFLHVSRMLCSLYAEEGQNH